MEENDEKTKGAISIPKNALFAMMAAVPMIGVLLSKGDIGALVLFILGIGIGIFVGKGFFESK
jgi:lipopolysaccharide export LptBFGC system permease protein LptF